MFFTSTFTLNIFILKAYATVCNMIEDNVRFDQKQNQIGLLYQTESDFVPDRFGVDVDHIVEAHINALPPAFWNNIAF